MKTQFSTALVAGAIGFAALTHFVAANVNSWEAYCTLAGSKHADPAHVCAHSNNDLTSQLGKQSDDYQVMFSAQDPHSKSLFVLLFGGHENSFV